MPFHRLLYSKKITIVKMVIQENREKNVSRAHLCLKVKQYEMKKLNISNISDH